MIKRIKRNLRAIRIMLKSKPNRNCLELLVTMVLIVKRNFFVLLITKRRITNNGIKILRNYAQMVLIAKICRNANLSMKRFTIKNGCRNHLNDSSGVGCCHTLEQ
jgi:hypothetical protein